MVVTAIAILSARVSFAAKNVSVLRMHPATDGGKYINVHQSDTMPQWSFNIGLMTDFAYEPFEFVTADGGRRRGIVDDLVVGNVHGAIAFTDWWLMGVNVPLVFWETYFNPYVPGEEVQREDVRLEFGDVKAEMKFRLLNIERYNVGISVVPFFYFPTGAEQYFIGTGMWSPGVMLALDGDIFNRVFLAVNAGYQYFSKYSYGTGINPSAVIDDRLILNAGLNVRITDAWAVIGEVISAGVISKLWKNQHQNPAEFLIGTRFTSQCDVKGLSITAGGGSSITSGIGSPDWRIFAMVNYRRLNLPPPPPVEVEVVVEEKIVITQSIHFEFDKAVIQSKSLPILDDVILIINQNPQIKVVRVEGHTDWIGTDQYNLKLSAARAKAVRDYLVVNGIAPDRLIAIGYGEHRPVADNRIVIGRARNRRTEFTVIDTEPVDVTQLPPPPPQYEPEPESQPQPEPEPQVAPEPAPEFQPQPVSTMSERPPEPEPEPRRVTEAPGRVTVPLPPPDTSSLGEIRSYTQIKGIIDFPNQQSELTEGGKKKLKEIANYVRKEKSVIGLRFQAFPGSADSEMGNSTLSWERAANARNYFASRLGDIKRRLDISSYGFTNSTYGEGKKANKGKVVIWVLRKFDK